MGDLLGEGTLREDLRYLRLLRDSSMEQAPAINALINMWLERNMEYLDRLTIDESSSVSSVPKLEELELPYHPIVVAMFQARSDDHCSPNFSWLATV